MLIWCGMLIYPTQMRTSDGVLHQFVTNGCLVPHILPQPRKAANNDNGEIAA